MPVDYKKYPPNWFSEIRPAILLRAKSACEFCGVENYSVILKGSKETRVVLTIAHLNHDVTNNEPWNLRALCQRCHLKHDQAHHQENRKRTRAKQRKEKIAASGQMEMIDEENTWTLYPTSPEARDKITSLLQETQERNNATTERRFLSQILVDSINEERTLDDADKLAAFQAMEDDPTVDQPVWQDLADKVRAEMEDDPSDNMRCSTCGTEVRWKVCPHCKGAAWINEDTPCLSCDGEGGKWVCDCDEEKP